MDFKMVGLQWNTAILVDKLIPFCTPGEIRDIVSHFQFKTPLPEKLQNDKTVRTILDDLLQRLTYATQPR